MKKAKLFLLLAVIFLFSGCAQMAWEKTSETNTIIGYQEFINKYPDSEYVSTARQRAEDLYWRQAQTRDTVQAYEEYIKEYSKGKYKSDARKRLEEISWHQAQKKNTINGYEFYLGSQYATKAYTQQAKERIEELYWGEQQADNSIDGYNAYLDKYPEGEYVFEAKNKLHECYWGLTIKQPTIQKFELYIKKYPEGKYAQNAKYRIEKLLWDEAERKKTDIALYREYLKKYPEGEYASLAKENILWADVEKADSVEQYNNYISLYPQGKFTERAALCLKIMDGGNNQGDNEVIYEVIYKAGGLILDLLSNYQEKKLRGNLVTSEQYPMSVSFGMDRGYREDFIFLHEDIQFHFNACACFYNTKWELCQVGCEPSMAYFPRNHVVASQLSSYKTLDPGGMMRNGVTVQRSIDKTTYYYKKIDGDNWVKSDPAETTIVIKECNIAFGGTFEYFGKNIEFSQGELGISEISDIHFSNGTTCIIDSIIYEYKNNKWTLIKIVPFFN